MDLGCLLIIVENKSKKNALRIQFGKLSELYPELIASQACSLEIKSRSALVHFPQDTFDEGRWEVSSVSL